MTLTGQTKDTRVLFKTKEDRERFKREAEKRREALKDWCLCVDLPTA